MYEKGRQVRITKFGPERGMIGVVMEVVPSTSPFAQTEYKVLISIGRYDSCQKIYTSSQIEPYINHLKCVCGSEYDQFGGHYSYCEKYMSGEITEEII